MKLLQDPEWKIAKKSFKPAKAAGILKLFKSARIPLKIEPNYLEWSKAHYKLSGTLSKVSIAINNPNALF